MINASSLSDAARLIEIQRELLANVPHVVPEIIVRKARRSISDSR
jgi:hypothetical protein